FARNTRGGAVDPGNSRDASYPGTGDFAGYAHPADCADFRGDHTHPDRSSALRNSGTANCYRQNGEWNTDFYYACQHRIAERSGCSGGSDKGVTVENPGSGKVQDGWTAAGSSIFREGAKECARIEWRPV